MARKNHKDDFTRGRMIEKLQEGRTVTSVAVSSESTKVSFRVLGKCSKPQQLASAISQQLCTATGRQVSRFTVARRLHKGGIFAHRPGRRLPLKVGHRRHRLQWCRELKNWTTDQWSRVLFTDESRFSTRRYSQHVLIWKEIGTGFYSSNLKERHRYSGPGVLVWGGIMLNG
ncbi:transposable element Tcb2 transposase [Trichonephila clavipes]|nr:transposable element Tcb2 transposase [Trichonephila clavipes]